MLFCRIYYACKISYLQFFFYELAITKPEVAISASSLNSDKVQSDRLPSAGRTSWTKGLEGAVKNSEQRAVHAESMMAHMANRLNHTAESEFQHMEELAKQADTRAVDAEAESTRLRDQIDILHEGMRMPKEIHQIFSS